MSALRVAVVVLTATGIVAGIVAIVYFLYLSAYALTEMIYRERKE
jgi:hypothetical protein